MNGVFYQNSATNGPHFTSDFLRKQLIRNLLQTAQVKFEPLTAGFRDVRMVFFGRSGSFTGPLSVKLTSAISQVCVFLITSNKA
jgi:hypothetical protein